MTVQLPDILDRDVDAPRIPDIELVGVFVGDIEVSGSLAAYPVKYRLNPVKFAPCTALWRGYVATYRLQRDGRLLLTRADYPFTPEVDPDLLDEELTGHFWISLLNRDRGQGVRIPFQNGRIVRDESAWRSFAITPQR